MNLGILQRKIFEEFSCFVHESCLATRFFFFTSNVHVCTKNNPGNSGRENEQTQVFVYIIKVV